MAIYRGGFSTCPVDDSPLAPLTSDPLVGTTIADQYTVDSCVGEGAMGRVYLAHHVRLTKRRFAIKVLLGDLAADPTMRLRFGQEAEAASRLQHPNVVSVLDFGKTDGGLNYLVMDFIEGGSLCDLVDQGAISEKDAIDLAKQICQGLTHAHEQGLVHRDFKPDNVALVEHDGKTIPKILDFGLAIISTPEESSVRLTSAGLVVGTPAYVSPEQSQGQAVDHRTDLFAFGVSLYEMLAGKLPFDGSIIDVLYKNATADTPPIAERSGIQVSPELEAIIAKLMAKAPGDRFASAREVFAALEAIESPATEVVQAFPAKAAASRADRQDIESAQTMAAIGAMPPNSNSAGAAAATESSAAAAQIAETVVIEQAASSSNLKILGIVGLLGAAAVAAFLLLGRGNKSEGAEGAVSSNNGQQPPDIAEKVEALVPVPVAAITEDAGPIPADATIAVVEYDAAPTKVVAVPAKPPKNRRPPKPKPANKPEPDKPIVAVVTVPDPPKPDPVVRPKPDPILAHKPKPVVTPKPLPKPKVPTSFKASTSIKKFDSDGSLSNSKVKQSLTPILSRLEACYETSARASKANAALSIKVKYTISENGRVEKISVGSAPLTGLSSCISKSLKKMRFRDHPDTGSQRVKFTLKYKPKQ